MTAKDLLFYLIRGFADKTSTNETAVSVVYKEGMGDFILRASTDIEYDELCLFNFKSGDKPRFCYILHPGAIKAACEPTTKTGSLFHPCKSGLVN